MSDQNYRHRPADEHSLSHEEIARNGISDSADFMAAPDDYWPDDMVWDLGDGVRVTQAELRQQE